jgi:hypothetical protein
MTMAEIPTYIRFFFMMENRDGKRNTVPKIYPIYKYRGMPQILEKKK